MMPEPAEPKRASDLWQTTCFEAFLRALGEQGYREWNFAPSTKWAAYDFNTMRAGMKDAEAAEPVYSPRGQFHLVGVWAHRSRFPPI